jgi:hypothetical protein
MCCQRQLLKALANFFCFSATISGKRIALYYLIKNKQVMRTKMIVAALIAVVMMGMNLQTQAAPWRGHGYWHRPHLAVQFYAAAPRVFAPAAVVVGRSYGYPAQQCAPNCNNSCHSNGNCYNSQNCNTNGCNNNSSYNGYGYDNSNAGYYNNGYSNSYSGYDNNYSRPGCR